MNNTIKRYAFGCGWPAWTVTAFTWALALSCLSLPPLGFICLLVPVLPLTLWCLYRGVILVDQENGVFHTERWLFFSFGRKTYPLKEADVVVVEKVTSLSGAADTGDEWDVVTIPLMWIASWTLLGRWTIHLNIFTESFPAGRRFGRDNAHKKGQELAAAFGVPCVLTNPGA